MMFYIRTIKQLETFYKNKMNGICVYGAGDIAIQFTVLMEYFYGTTNMIKEYIVSKKKSGDEYLLGKRVTEFDSNKFGKNDYVILALRKKDREEVLELLSDIQCNIYILDSQMMYDDKCKEIFYEDCINDIRDYIKSISYKIEDSPIADDNTKLYAWTCWWQGEECAPEIVKACINSQRCNLPPEVCHVVITKENFHEYIEIPEYILQKVNSGKITYTTFSDIIREKLIFKYGGIWFDSTVLINKTLPIDFFKIPLFTCKSNIYDFESFSKWSLWCMGAQKNNLIFKFLYEAFEYYYRKYDSIKYYLTVDYFIKAAMEYVPGANEQYDKIPCNNTEADKLAPHLKDIYSKDKYEEYIKNTYISKLTYKHFSGRNGRDFTGFDKDSIYQFILNKYSN